MNSEDFRSMINKRIHSSSRYLGGGAQVRGEVLANLGGVGEGHAELQQGQVVLPVHLLQLLARPARHGGGHAGPED